MEPRPQAASLFISQETQPRPRLAVVHPDSGLLTRELGSKAALLSPQLDLEPVPIGEFWALVKV